MANVKEAMLKIESHEKECALRYSNIEKRLDEGSKKFEKLEKMIFGLYIAFAASLGIDKFIL
jgi:cell division protein FtsL